MPLTYVQGLEIRDYLGVQLDVITDHYGGRWKQAVNAADELRFTVPTALLPASCTFGNEVWLRRGDNASLCRKFIITSLTTRNGERAETDVICYDYISQLGRVAVTNVPDAALYGTDCNVMEYIYRLVAEQSAESSIHMESRLVWGTIPANIADDTTLPYDDLYVENTYVLPSLHRLRDTLGGMLWADNDHYLHWYVGERFPVPPATYTLELNRNVIRANVDDDRLSSPVVGTQSYDFEVVDLSGITGEDDGMLNIGMPVWYGGVKLYITDIDQSLSNPLQLTIGVSDDPTRSGRKPDALDAIVDIAADLSESRRTQIVEMQKTERLEDWVASPAPTLAIKPVAVANASGTRDDWAPSDHEHALEVGVLTQVIPYGTDVQDVGADNAAGVSTDVARVDHVHKGVVAFGTDIQSVGTGNGPGTSDTAARSNHVHQGTMVYGTSIQNVGTANAAGDASSAARANHVHALTASPLESLGYYILRHAKIININTNLNTVSAYLWDFAANNWSGSATNVYLPHSLAASTWSGQTLTYKRSYYDAGIEITYEASGAYQRIATWTESEVEYTETQELTPPYFVNEQISVIRIGSNWYDLNTAGRCWASVNVTIVEGT